MPENDGHKFVEILLRDGKNVPCDKDASYKIELPEWVDHDKIKKGQKFFFKNIFAMVYNILVLLMHTFAEESILKIIISTKRSSDLPLAYSRFKTNILHTLLWMKYPLKPGTKAWQSIETVRRIHINRSITSEKAGIGIISQKDLTLIQMTLIGFAMSDPDKTGFRGTPEEFEGYNHLWRVLGHLHGCKEQYNLCGDTVEITKNRMNAIKKQILIPTIKNPPAAYVNYVENAINSMFYFFPFITFKTAMYFGKRWIGLQNYHYFDSEKKSKDDDNKNNLNQLSFCDRVRLFWTILVLQYMTRFWLFHWTLNKLFLLAVNILELYPVFALYKFGAKKAHVKIYYDKK